MTLAGPQLPNNVLDPITNAQSFDFIVIGQTKSPGLAKVGEFKRKNEWDQKKGKGAVGATITYIQRPPATGTIRFELWLPQHFADWVSFRDLFKYDASKQAPEPVDIYHPTLADIDLYSVVTEEIGNLVHEGKGLWVINVSLLEYFKPPDVNASSTPQGSNSISINDPATTVDAEGKANEAKIKALLAKASEP